jgi:hypothetical protein
VFTDDEWKAVTEAPLRITLAVVSVGPHSVVSVLKEGVASARATAQPADPGPAADLIAEITRGAESHEARHDVRAHAGKSRQEIATQALNDLEPAARALGRLAPDEAAKIRAWFMDIGKAVAAASKSTSPEEQDVLDKISGIFSPPS